MRRDRDRADSDQQVRPVVVEQMAELDADPRRKRQIDVDLPIDLGELRDHERDQADEGRHEGDQHDEGILEHGTDLGLDLVFVADDVDEALQDLRQRAAGLPRQNHAGVQGRKHVGMALQRLGQGGTAADVQADLPADVLETRILRLAFQNVRHPQECRPSAWWPAAW